MNNKTTEKQWFKWLYAVDTHAYYGIYTSHQLAQRLNGERGYNIRKYKYYNQCIKFFRSRFDDITLEFFDSSGKGVMFDVEHKKQGAIEGLCFIH